MGQDRTSPSAVVQEVTGGTLIEEASVPELLMFCIARAEAAIEALTIPETLEAQAAQGAIVREYRLSITALEDAITRWNKGTYRAKGTFAITDAERS